MQIKFRGRDRKTGGFVYGDLIQPCHEYEFVPTIRAGWSDYREVDAESVAQLIGVDKNGEEIYEGDMIIGVGKQEYPAEFKPNFVSQYVTLKEDNHEAN